MNAPHSEEAFVREIDETLAALAAVRPRDGLEQRVLARLATAPATPWYLRWTPALPGFQAGSQRRWMLVAASAVIVVSGVTIGLHRTHPAAPVQMPIAAHMPRPAQQPVAAASGVAVSSHPLQSHTIRTRHRGVRPAYRATHDRAPLPRGTAVPIRPRVMSSEQ